MPDAPNPNQHDALYKAGIITTTDGKPPESLDGPAPGPIGKDGMHTQYWVLSEAERAKGFLRPVRYTYRHVGAPGPQFPMRDLTDKERARYPEYVKFEPYPPGHEGSVTGRYWTQTQLDAIGRGCGVVTRMGALFAETWARDPRYYGGTYCVGCGAHFPVNEFTWDGSEERLGS